ncbi:hypothetical protein [Nocardioides bruguierae]|uniref:Uncharacterized protein n=1 Tax=Nocardioides bruguierae TaxID=2945102 RepID=A0A9X2DDJ9_9ACTN|nr:hypothetical protein [Nocardioides bruguierae]MCM0622514.1 hypothetical protein [Nocardioides bruguierae]
MADHLPSTSHLRNALAQDEELAEMLEDRITAGRDREPQIALTEMTAEWQMQAQTVALLQALVSQGARRKVSFPPLPRPMTATEKLRKKRREEARERTTSRIAAAQARWDANHPAPAPPTS